MLTLDNLPMPISLLLLLLELHRLRLNPHDPYTTLKQPFVQVIRLPGSLGVVAFCIRSACFEREVAAAEDRGPVEAQDVPWRDVLHVKGQAERVAFCDEVGEFMDVRYYVVRFLGMEFWKEILYGAGEDEGLGEWRRCRGGSG